MASSTGVGSDSPAVQPPPAPPSSPQPPPLSKSPPLTYGTSGYRARWTLLSPDIVSRTAYYAANRAIALRECVGLMITASHNPPEDNGVKVIDWNGSMLPLECESELNALISLSDAQYRQHCFATMDSTPVGERSENVKVVIGTDTRHSSPTLLEEAIRGCRLAGVPVELFERHTTPQLHFIVRATNSGGGKFALPSDYVHRFQCSFAESLELIPEVIGAGGSGYANEIYVDCANGVGALWLEKYINGRRKSSSESVAGLYVHLVNTDVDAYDRLNLNCGADHVKISKALPSGFHDVPEGSKCASLDGDADRLVYFYPVGVNLSDGTAVTQLRLLDGDHICVLFAKFIKDQLNVGKNCSERLPLTFGVVQTAYSNGNSTRYLRQELMIEPLMVSTGVKYLDKAARQFDIGVYFEANGHGTVSFSKKFHAFVDSAKRAGSGKANEPLKHIVLLELFSRLVNEVVGDGIADLLAVETLLRYYGWSIRDWEEKTYVDLPNCQLKIKVKDRSRYESQKDDESQLVRPEGMQTSIDNILADHSHARAFIRPSGTEEIVRVYAEARSQQDADAIAKCVEKLVLEHEQSQPPLNSAVMTMEPAFVGDKLKSGQRLGSARTEVVEYQKRLEATREEERQESLEAEREEIERQKRVEAAREEIERQEPNKQLQLSLDFA